MRLTKAIFTVAITMMLGASGSAIADEAVKREIVPSISRTAVRSFLKSGRSSAASKQVLAVSEDR